MHSYQAFSEIGSSLKPVANLVEADDQRLNIRSRATSSRGPQAGSLRGGWLPRLSLQMRQMAD
jgi:hypothetical protein